VVGEGELLSAVEGILAQADLSLRQGSKELMAETLRLRSKLAATALDLERSRGKVAQLSVNYAKVPDEFRCPITCELMAEPVICADGHTYEREAIERWFRSHGTSPKTNAHLPNRTVFPNHALRGVIEAFKARRGL
jgi:hypothetical protein